MRAYLRTSRRTGISMPWYLALVVGAVWLVVMLAVLFYGLAAIALIWLGRTGVHGWQRWRSSHPR